jgi:hypothetical protein
MAGGGGAAIAGARLIIGDALNIGMPKLLPERSSSSFMPTAAQAAGEMPSRGAGSGGAAKEVERGREKDRATERERRLRVEVMG